jgi:hypothetical protein
MPQVPIATEGSLRDSLKEFLRYQSHTVPTPQYCEHCGALCVYISAQFWLDGDEESWQIPLPFCRFVIPNWSRGAPLLERFTMLSNQVRPAGLSPSGMCNQDWRYLY